MDFKQKALEIEENAALAGLSINELCKLANVARTTLTRWKNKSTIPNYATISKLESTIALVIASNLKKGKRKK